MSSTHICMLVAIAVYLVMMLYIGIRCMKGNKNTDDFYLGGRGLGPYVTAMSAEASDMSGWLLMGLPGVAYLSGFAEATWTALGLAIGTYLNWLIVAKRLRNYTEVCNNSTTIPEFFMNRYRDSSYILKIVSALIIVVFFVPYTASGFMSCGKLFASLFGWDYFTSMIICAVIIVGYTTMGGFLAASTTDFVQSIVMTIALFVVVGFGEGMANGFENIFAEAGKLPSYLNFTSTYNPVTGTSQPYGILKIASLLAWGLGYFGMPHVLLRFMAIENPQKLKTSRRVASVWVVISLAVAILIGVVGMAMTKVGALPTLADSETIVVDIAKLLSSFGYIPAVVAGIILSGILASTMSTADSQLLAASSSVSSDIMSVIGKQFKTKTTMLIARVTVIVISVIAVFIAKNPEGSIFTVVSFAWAGFGASFGPVVLLALFWKRSNRWGAIAGMISGGVMVFVWKYLIAPFGGIFEIYELLPAFVTGLVLNIIVSLLTKAPDKEITDEFEKVSHMA